tara:strand:+ start:58 stop:528 length:471 start_codon:yes stop_codon:yes gene_type:complete
MVSKQPPFLLYLQNLIKEQQNYFEKYGSFLIIIISIKQLKINRGIQSEKDHLRLYASPIKPRIGGPKRNMPNANWVRDATFVSAGRSFLEAAIEIAIGKITALPAPIKRKPNIANIIEFDKTTKNTPINMTKRLAMLIKIGPNLLSKLSPKNLTKA